MSATDAEGEGGHPCGSPLAPPTKVNTGRALPERATRRSRWASSLPAVSTAPPQGVDPESRSTAHRSSPTRPTSDTGEEVIDAPAPQAAAQPKLQELPSTHSKAPEVTEQQKGRAPEHAMIDALQSRLNAPPPPATGLLSIAATRPTATAVMNPKMPAAATSDSGAHMPRKDEAPMTEIFLEETDDRAGTVDADITHLAEQRAMHTVLRYQMQALRHSAPADSSSVVESTALAPVAPPLSLYANLPQEWPLARLSVQLRHIGVMLRVTLFRRVAELNFRGVEFRRLPREVMTSIIHDFNNIAGELARRLASLFHFLKSVPSTNKQADELGLTLYAEPKYWLYGLLSFCAKACEAKIEEANGRPVQKAKEEGGVPDLEATGKTLALMQTVVMSFGRNQRLGTPDLPIHRLHVYFPVQLVHKLIARMRTDLHFTEATQEKGNYKHNSESETNSPYIVVGTYENECRPNTSYGATLPDTPSLAVAYEQGLLDGNLGQMVSFQSTYKSTLRIEVPVWPDVRQAVLPPTQTKPPLTKQEDDSGALDRANKVEEETEEVEDDKYVPPDGQGCFSFRQSLLLRAKDTYAARSIGNKYEIMSRWLLTGLAVVLSRPNWLLLAKKGTLIKSCSRNTIREDTLLASKTK